MIKVTFEAQTFSELHQQLHTAIMTFDNRIAGVMPPRMAEILEEPTRVTTPTVTEEDSRQLEMMLPTEDQPTKKRGRKKKETEDVEVEATADKKTYTKEDTYAALQKVNTTVSLAAAREILLSFGVQRMSELKEDQFATFVKRCEEALA